MPRPEDYTVGWISAIQIESVAAGVFLDEEHGSLESQPPTDSNNYRFGKIAGHNVVIAILPLGIYGKASAASVASHMVRTFPNVRIGLMVGIGGGAPSSKNDIRLGDVVVGVPTDREGGVLPYDLGKEIQGVVEFQITGTLNQPPQFLLTAVNNLGIDLFKPEGHNLHGKIERALKGQNATLRRTCQRPNPARDLLYHSHVVHPVGAEGDCSEICGSTPKHLNMRPPRPDDRESLKIHYGLIASADRVMKDALTRDKISAQYNVLCFEMEAAGLMNHFPCLVIRGICDYSDSHKNKEWQGYAAMAAAAYARDLLKRIPPSTVDSQKAILATVEKSLKSLTDGGFDTIT